MDIDLTKECLSVQSFVIEIPRKVNLKKVQRRFEYEALYDDVHGGVFIFK